MAGAGPALMAVGIGVDTEPVSHFEGVLDQPFKGAPGGMGLEGAFHTTVMSHFDVGITAANMSKDDTVFFLQGLEQIRGPGAVGVDIRAVFNQRM